jgi:conserved hypothetical protein
LAVDGVGITLFPVNLVEALKTRKVQIGIAVVAILLAVALTLVWVLQPKNDNPSQAASVPAASSSAGGNADGTAATSPDASAAPASPGACSPTDGDGFIPVKYSLESPEAIEANVLSLGRDSEGNVKAPPKDEPTTASWWNEGPAAGSNAGQVVLSIHTYQSGEAVGNKLYKDGTSQLKTGDVLKLYSQDGRVACYEYTGDQKITEAEFDPASEVLERKAGDPELAIVICWDHNSSTNNWDSRIFFKFKPVAA